MKKENFSLHLEASGEIRVFDAEMQFDEDAENDKFSAVIDGEKFELSGDTESIFEKLSELLNGRYTIHSCFTCRHGNFCPFGDEDNEIFCVNDLQPKCKSDLFFICDNSEERNKRKRTLFDVCEDFKPCCNDFYTYK